jgi:hypothetical protein
MPASTGANNREQDFTLTIQAREEPKSNTASKLNSNRAALPSAVSQARASPLSGAIVFSDEAAILDVRSGIWPGQLMLQGRAFLVDNNDHVQIGELVATYGPDRRRFDVSVRRIEARQDHIRARRA